MDVSGQFHALAALTPAETAPFTHLTFRKYDRYGDPSICLYARNRHYA
jgi:hypothetical protein